MNQREKDYLRIRQETTGNLVPIDYHAPAAVQDQDLQLAGEAIWRQSALWPVKDTTIQKFQQFFRNKKRASTPEFYKSILTDQMEALLTLAFMTFLVPLEDGTFMPWKPDPLQFQAFKLAIAYKRGMPKLKMETEDKTITQGPRKVVVPVEYTGASPDFFSDQAKSAGLIK